MPATPSSTGGFVNQNALKGLRVSGFSGVLGFGVFRVLGFGGFGAL